MNKFEEAKELLITTQDYESYKEYLNLCSDEIYEEAVFWYMTLIILGSSDSKEAGEEIWYISKKPGLKDMIIAQVRSFKEYEHLRQNNIWQQMDDFIRTDYDPEFMRN